MSAQQRLSGDYAKWGAALAFKLAPRARAQAGEARHDCVRKARGIVEETALAMIRAGASDDEVNLYRTGFDRCIEAALDLPAAGGVVRVRILTGASGDDIVVEERIS